MPNTEADNLTHLAAAELQRIQERLAKLERLIAKREQEQEQP